MPDLPEKIGKYPIIGTAGHGNMGMVKKRDQDLTSELNMSAKLEHRPFGAEGSSIAENAPAHGMNLVLGCIRQVQASAEQICRDAADIEDARHLAENIVDACRRVLANGNGVTSNPRPRQGARTEARALAKPAPVENPEPSREAAALGKLRGLSARELEIFTHLAEGRSAAEIAVTLSRSSKTINNHRTRILQKLGVRNATQLVRLAVHSGLVSV